MTPLVKIYVRILNAFENDSGSPETEYKPIYIYGDGNGGRKQITLARGFTSDGGNLQKVIRKYISKSGKDAEYMKSKVDVGTPAMVSDREFQRRLSSAGDEEAMRSAQDEVFEEEYLYPALQWAARHGFIAPLSVAVVVDSFLHSGGMPKWLMDKFPEPKPSIGGNEKEWIKSYLKERLAWFNRVSGELHNATYRPKFFLGEINKGNWNLDCPLIANGAKIC